MLSLKLVAWVISILLVHPACAWWPFRRPDISSRHACSVASHHHVWHGDSIYGQLQGFLKVNGPVLQLPQELTDVMKYQTIMQLAVPNMTLVLDPLLWLSTLKKNPGIPKLIHMTMKDKHKLAPHQILSMLSWGYFNEGYALLLYDNDDITNYMQRYHPGFMPIYNQLKTPVEKSDAWRYHVLCSHGGVYADTDTICARPFEQWVQFNTTPEPGLIVGIENRFYSQQEAEEASYVHKIQVTQWTMASKRAHPVVCRMGGAIKAFVERELVEGNALEADKGHDASILLRTGPGIWSTEVHKYVREMGSQPEEVVLGGQVTDLVVLPQAAFGCNFRYWNLDNLESVVYHMYNNSWKVDHFKVADAKKLQRQRRQRQSTLRVLYPLLVVLSAAFGVLAAAYAGLCYMQWHGPGAPGKGSKRRRRGLTQGSDTPSSSSHNLQAASNGTSNFNNSSSSSSSTVGSFSVSTSRLQQQVVNFRKVV